MSVQLAKLVKGIGAIKGFTTGTTESTFDQQHELDETTPITFPTYMTEMTDAVASHTDSESNNTVLIIMGVLLGILVLVCCVLAFIFARMRRKGFCPVDGRNQESCDLDCPENGMSSEVSPKESMTSAKSINSSSDKLLTK
ncbi:uncharacterized protein LOC105684873 [Athalia rosae]|uniref:uncharacterized protein LOC105684873 n=1 Tax=Athalia rosae TaxID=37344 RepID=UPI000626B86E|nr:uncharacterized protein LOC105684873 [Athalia rosae]